MSEEHLSYLSFRPTEKSKEGIIKKKCRNMCHPGDMEMDFSKLSKLTEDKIKTVLGPQNKEMTYG